MPFTPAVTWLGRAALLLALLAAGLLVTLVALRRYGSRPLTFLLRPLAGLPGFSQARTELAAAGILRGLSGLRDPRMALASFSLTVLFWLGFTLALRCVGLELGLDAGILVAVATTFSLLLPALPASVGIFEAAALVALEPYGVDAAQALSGAVLIHVMTFVPFLIAGPLALRGHAVIVRRDELRAAGSGSTRQRLTELRRPRRRLRERPVALEQYEAARFALGRTSAAAVEETLAKQDALDPRPLAYAGLRSAYGQAMLRRLRGHFSVWTVAVV